MLQTMPPGSRPSAEKSAQVLVVDDEESMVWALRKIVESMGLQIASASTAERALDAARAGATEVLLLDVKLPGLSGLAEAPPGDVFRRIESRWEKALFRRILDRTDGNQLKASELLGITRTTVKRKMDLHGL